MRICLVYDCLFPHTVGGAERWYRNLGERLAADGHDVTYLTLRQWDRGDGPGRPRRAGRRRRAADGALHRRAAADPPAARLRARRAVASAAPRPPLRRRPHRVVPVLLAARGGACAALCGFRLVVDWHEVWSREYWIEYLGAAGPASSARPSSGCACRIAPARLLLLAAARRAPAQERAARGGHGARGRVHGGRLTGRVRAPPSPSSCSPGATSPRSGRRPWSGPSIEAAAADPRPARRDLRRRSGARDVLRGDPDAGAQDTSSAPGFVDAEEVDTALGSALCMLLPSRREGYGLIVVEAASGRAEHRRARARTTRRPS